RDTPGEDAVLHVVHRVGHVVRPVHDLRFQTANAVGRPLANPLEDVDVVRVDAELALARLARPRVFGGRVEAGSGEVEPDRDVVLEVFRLESAEDAQRLCVALVAADAGRDLVQGRLAVVSEGRVADVVRQAGQVHQVGVAAQVAGDAAADLGDLERVGQPGAGHAGDFRALPRADDLCLAGQSA